MGGLNGAPVVQVGRDQERLWFQTQEGADVVRQENRPNAAAQAFS